MSGHVRVFESDAEHAAKILSLIGLARRAGSVKIGTELALTEAKKKPQSVLIVTASDASERTVKQVRDKCAASGARLLTLAADKYSLAHACGSGAAASAVSVTSAGLIAEILRISHPADDKNT